MNTSNIVSLIVAAIAVMALLIPGLDGLKASVEGLRDAKKIEHTEFCLAKVARQKTNPENEEEARLECIQEITTMVNNNFQPALNFIAAFRQALTLQQSGATPTSSSTGT